MTQLLAPLKAKACNSAQHSSLQATSGADVSPPRPDVLRPPHYLARQLWLPVVPASTKGHRHDQPALKESQLRNLARLTNSEAESPASGSGAVMSPPHSSFPALPPREDREDAQHFGD
jgi:hypothetical protein